MFPINPQGIVLGGVVYYLYIPLCFLLILFEDLDPSSPTFFTFHYVSY